MEKVTISSIVNNYVTDVIKNHLKQENKENTCISVSSPYYTETYDMIMKNISGFKVSNIENDYFRISRDKQVILVHNSNARISSIGVGTGEDITIYINPTYLQKDTNNALKCELKKNINVLYIE